MAFRLIRQRHATLLGKRRFWKSKVYSDGRHIGDMVMDRAKERNEPGILTSERTTIAEERLTANNAIATKEVRIVVVFMTKRL